MKHKTKSASPGESAYSIDDPPRPVSTKHVDGQWNVKWHGEVGPKGWMSVRAAITAVQENDSLSEILRAAIGFTGDVDTVATIALGSASCSAEVVDDLPRHLLDDLENGNFGRDYLNALDKSLLGK